MTEPSVAINETAVSLIRTLQPIVIPKAQALLDRIGDDLSDAEDMDITNPTLASIGQELAGRISTVLAAMDKERLSISEPARDAQKWVNDGYKPVMDKLDGVLQALKNKLLVFDRAERVKAQKLADAAAEEAKARQRVADQQAADARARAAELIEEAQVARKMGDGEEADKLVAEAQHLDASAAEVVETAALAATIPTGSAVVRSSGVKGGTKKWKGRMTIKQRLLLRCANDPSLENLFDLNEANLNAYAQLTKGTVPLPGVEFYEEEGLRVAKRPV